MATPSPTPHRNPAPPDSDAGGAPEPHILRFVLGPHQTNCYLVAIEARCWIIDAGFGAEALVETIRQRGWTPEALILTHAHADHIGGVREIRAAFPDLPIHIHPDEREWLADPELNLSAPMGFPVTAPPASHMLEEGQILELVGTRWRVLHTPGHSPGGVTLHCPELGVALVGDVLFQGSTGRWDFPTSDEMDLRRSITERLFDLPDETIVLSGHGEQTTIGDEKANNPVVRDMWGWNN